MLLNAPQTWIFVETYSAYGKAVVAEMVCCTCPANVLQRCAGLADCSMVMLLVLSV